MCLCQKIDASDRAVVPLLKIRFCHFFKCIVIVSVLVMIQYTSTHASNKFLSIIFLPIIFHETSSSICFRPVQLQKRMLRVTHKSWAFGSIRLSVFILLYCVILCYIVLYYTISYFLARNRKHSSENEGKKLPRLRSMALLYYVTALQREIQNGLWPKSIPVKAIQVSQISGATAS